MSMKLSLCVLQAVPLRCFRFTQIKGDSLQTLLIVLLWGNFGKSLKVTSFGYKSC